MTTKALKEMAGMMEHKSLVQHQVLTLIINELQARGCRIDHLKLGVDDVNAEDKYPQ